MITGGAGAEAGEEVGAVGGFDDGVGDVGVVAGVVGAGDEKVAEQVDAVDELDPAEAGGEQDGAGVVGELLAVAVGVGVEAVAGAVEGIPIGSFPWRTGGRWGSPPRAWSRVAGLGLNRTVPRGINYRVSEFVARSHDSGNCIRFGPVTPLAE
jgi:hypothetical protein